MNVAQKQKVWKKKVTDRRKGVENMQAMAEIADVDVKVSLIQTLIPVGLEKLGEELQQEVLKLAGAKGIHGKENNRWGEQWGSVYMLDQKVPVKILRVRNKDSQREVALQTYKKMQHPYQEDEQVFKKLLNGLSTHKYAESANLAPEVFGLSASNMSKRLKKATAERLQKLMTRDLSKHDFIAIRIRVTANMARVKSSEYYLFRESSS